MGEPLRVLMVEDREDDALLIVRALNKAGFTTDLTRVDNEADMRRALVSSAKWDVILSDYMLPLFSCHRALEILEESGLDIPFISISGTVSEETILTALRAGARDYVMKDNLSRLPSAIRREIREAEERRYRRRLEAQLQQTSKMEAIGRLAGGVAHDFNNLLTVISGFAQLALFEDNPAREGLEQILLASDRAAALTRQLLAFSRQQELAPRRFDLNQMIRNLEPMLRRLIGENVEMTVRTSAEPMTVQADPSQMEQVVLNLVVNARDAMPKGGALILSTAWKSVEGSSAAVYGVPDGDYCSVSVSDTGTGIPPEILPHIFEPFFTTKESGKGTGLGLATVYGVLKQSGGAIHAYSEPGVGTVMTALVPHAEPSVVADKGAPKENMPRGTETVLVAEDDANVLKLVAETLIGRGFQVIRAVSGNRALELLNVRNPPHIDLLITDVVMPGMGGPDFAREAVKILPWMKVLFMSGYTEDVVELHGIPAGADFIQKPFVPRELVQKVRKLLDSERQKALTA